MLQASEYHPGDFLRWYHKVKNFATVEQRKQLVRTKKAQYLLAVSWVILLIGGISAVSLLMSAADIPAYINALLVIVVLPYIVPYVLLGVVFGTHILIERPVEYLLMRRARNILAAHPAKKIAIAGSFGKTTTREILKTVLSESKRVAAPPHNHNTPLGICEFIATLRGDEEVLIFELGEYYPGDVRTLCDLIKPDMGFITGINEAHLEKFKTLDRTAATIFELADHLGDKRLYVNGENDLAKTHARTGHILYDRSGVDEWRVTQPHTNIDGTSFELVHDRTQLMLHSSLLGLHHVGPLAAAADCAIHLGLSPTDVMRGVAATKPFEHRLHPATDSAGVTTLDDSYNGNPDGVMAVIAFLSSLAGRRRWYVTPGLVEMGERTRDVHIEIGKQLATAQIEKVILIKNSVTPSIADGLKEGGYTGDLLWYDDALEAFRALPLLTVSGDVVLLQNDWPDQYQ